MCDACSIERRITLICRRNPTNLSNVSADNAGCYHGAEFLLSIKQLFKETGILIRRSEGRKCKWHTRMFSICLVDFSDPQSGKSACDRMAAVIKCNIRRHINEKHNCTNSKEFIEAARETNHLSIYASLVASEGRSPSVNKVGWPGISSFNNIEYSIVAKPKASRTVATTREEDDLEARVWRAWSVGIGKSFLWNDLHAVTCISPLKTVDAISSTNNNWASDCAAAGKCLVPHDSSE